MNDESYPGIIFSGVAAMNVFLGLNASAEELGVKRQNCWAFTTNNIDHDGLEYFNMDVDQVRRHFMDGFLIGSKSKQMK